MDQSWTKRHFCRVQSNPDPRNLVRGGHARRTRDAKLIQIDQLPQKILRCHEDADETAGMAEARASDHDMGVVAADSLALHEGIQVRDYRPGTYWNRLKPSRASVRPAPAAVGPKFRYEVL
jgi:hypothetical protein